MLSILKEHLIVLNDLKLLIEKEKEVLITLDEEALIKIVDKKSEKVEEIEFVEMKRKEMFDKMSFQLFVKEDYKAEKIVRQIKKTLNEIKITQETNTILTEQSMNYNSNLMKIIRNSLKKGARTYGYDGKMNGTNIRAKGSLDKSI